MSRNETKYKEIGGGQCNDVGDRIGKHIERIGDEPGGLGNQANDEHGCVQRQSGRENSSLRW